MTFGGVRVLSFGVIVSSFQLKGKSRLLLCTSDQIETNIRVRVDGFFLIEEVMRMTRPNKI